MHSFPVESSCRVYTKFSDAKRLLNYKRGLRADNLGKNYIPYEKAIFAVKIVNELKKRSDTEVITAGSVTATINLSLTLRNNIKEIYFFFFRGKIYHYYLFKRFHDKSFPDNFYQIWDEYQDVTDLNESGIKAIKKLFKSYLNIFYPLRPHYLEVKQIINAISGKTYIEDVIKLLQQYKSQIDNNKDSIAIKDGQYYRMLDFSLQKLHCSIEIQNVMASCDSSAIKRQPRAQCGN